MYVHRALERTLEKYLSAKEILAVIGPRQCGKTTLLDHLLKDKQKVSKVSFDDVKVLQLFENDIDSFYELYGAGYRYLFIDEVHYSGDSGKKLKYLYDKYTLKILISGSSAAEISIQCLKYLTGRILIFTLYPFSFGEFVRAKDEKLAKLYGQGAYGGDVVRLLNKHLDAFLLYGGYPRVVLARDDEERQRVLRGIYSTFLLKEIKEILGLADNHKLVALMKALALQLGGLLSYKELGSLAGLPFPDLKGHLQILEETFVCKRVLPYSSNKRTELVKVPKIYFFDSGFRNVCIDNFAAERSDKGALHENFIFSELAKKDLQTRFWRAKSGAEVDFVVNETPIEVKSTVADTTLERSFHSYLEKYKPKRGYVLSAQFSGSRKVKGCDVVFMELVRFAGGFKA